MIDLPGAALPVAAVTCVMLVTVWGGREYAWSSPEIGGLLVLAIVLAAVFIWWERRAANPVLPPHLFRAPAFRFAVPASLVLGVLLLGAVVFLPQFFQAVRGMSAATSGLCRHYAALADVPPTSEKALLVGGPHGGADCAPPAGLEPAAKRLEGACSIH